jgi:hypothetical protein
LMTFILFPPHTFFIMGPARVYGAPVSRITNTSDVGIVAEYAYRVNNSFLEE